MKGIYGVLCAALGLAATGRGRATTFIARDQPPYDSGIGGSQEQIFQYGGSQSSGHAAPESQGLLSHEGLHQNSRLRRPGSGMTWRSPPLVTPQGSLVQVQSESEEAESAEEEDAGDRSASTKESHGGTEKPTPPDDAEVASEHQKHSDGTPKEDSTEETAKETADGKLSTSEEGKPEASDQETSLHTKNEAISKSHAETEKERVEPAAHGAEKAKTDVSKNTKNKETLARGPEARLASPEPSDFDALMSRLRPLLLASKGKELFAKLMTILDLHGNTQTVGVVALSTLVIKPIPDAATCYPLAVRATIWNFEIARRSHFGGDQTLRTSCGVYSR